MAYMFNQCTFVLKCITLAQVVELVVEVLVDLARGSVFDEEAAENTQTTHPHNLSVLHQNISHQVRTPNIFQVDFQYIRVL